MSAIQPASTINLFGLNIYALSKEELLQELQRHLRSNNKQLLKIFTPNPEQVIQSQEDRRFFSELQQADYLLPDGLYLVRASQLFHLLDRRPRALSQRITGVEVIEALLQWTAREKMPVLVVGGRNYRSKLPANVSWTPAYAHKEQILPKEEQQVEALIKKLRPKIVFVAFGAPAQERWILRHQALLEKNGVKLAMVAGGAFDFLWGQVKRAPQIWQDLGLEWFYRLLQEPWRAKRQTRLFSFVLLTFKEVLNS